MSLDEAMNIIENYDQNRLNSLVGAIKDRYDNVIDREIDKSTLAKNNEQLYNILDQAHSLVQFVDESFDYATDDFLEYVAEQNAQEPTALKITPASRMGDLITKFISGNMYMDDN
jgi:ferritin